MDIGVIGDSRLPHINVLSMPPIFCTPDMVLTALHEMQTQSSDENSVCLSVRPSVCLSVTRVIPDKMEERSVQIFIPCKRTIILVF